MQVIKKPQQLQTKIKKIRQEGKTIGFVPTMGALHEGHLSLIKKARQQNDIVIVSIFINPTQFGPKEDLKKYPRSLKRDLKLTRTEKVDFIFTPSIKDIYPNGFKTNIYVSGTDNILCGKSRPGHFQGVTTVVSKLLNITLPHALYLGQKDAQQAIILKKMIADLNFPVKVIVCPTVREKDGLALSSRNKYLSTSQRKQAPVLYEALQKAQKKVLTGERNATKIKSLIRNTIRRETNARIDYIACVDAQELKLLKKLKGTSMIAVAVKFAKTRLIDNIIVRFK